MGLLAFCWLIAELHVIPNGFLKKWFYLSFYIHPFFLVFCQIILWLKQLQKWLLLILYFRIARSTASFITTSTDNNQVFNDAMEPEIPTLVQGWSKIVLHSRWIPRTAQVATSKFDHYSIGNSSNVFEEHVNSFEAAQETDGSSWLHEYLYSDHYTCTIMTTYYELMTSSSPQTAPYPLLHEVKDPFVTSFGREDSEISNFHDQSFHKKPLTYITNVAANVSSSSNTNILPSVDRPSSEPPAVGLIHQSTSRTVQDDDTQVDMFFKQYIQRMRFYNFLYHERLCGMKAILCEHSTIPVLFMRNQQSIDVSESARKRLLKSLECEFELTCVAQVCLSWEALHYQYWTFEALTTTPPNDPQFSSIHPNASDIFQEFNILLEKFMEDEGSNGQRYSDYLHARISFQSLLQVPDVAGYIVKEENNCMGGEAIIASCPSSHVLGAIKKCIKTLFLYIKADNKRMLRKQHNGIFRSTKNPSVQDPGDLESLYQVTKSLQKKMKLLADPNKRWLKIKRQWKPPDDLLFAMIDIQLVQRLLKMPLVSSSHLKWCQEKLNNLEIRQGKLYRAPTSHLFPIS